MNPYKIELTDTYEVVDQMKIYNQDRCFEFIVERGKSIFGYHFAISPQQRFLYRQLIAYAIEDQKLTAKLNLDLNKGLLLMGDTGVGKTAIIRLIQYFFSPKKKYEIKHCRVLAQEFSCKGHEIFTPLFAANAKSLCLDGLGRESIARNFGSTCDVIHNVVEHFYEQRFDQTYPKLHLITGLTASELEKRYGKHFRKMLTELFNVVVCER